MKNYAQKVVNRLKTYGPVDPKYGINMRLYDFLDLGSKDGGSIDYCKSRFHARRGLGVDFRGQYVDEANSMGRDTLNEDVLKLEIAHKFRFISMMDFLEHLLSKEDSFKVIEKTSQMATDFLFIRHPSFEDVGYLKQLGLKMSWHDWKGHTNMLTLQDYLTMFDKLGLNKYFVRYISPINTTASKFVVPLDAPVDTLAYDAKKHGKKPKVKFDKTLYAKLDIFVPLRNFSKSEWDEITKPLDSDNGMGESWGK